MITSAFRKAKQFILADEGSLKTRVLRSGVWVGIGESIVTIISILKSIVLARLLSPDMFGLMGLCNMFLRMIETFTRPGIGQALIQRQSSFEEARDTAFTLLVARGLLLTVLLLLLAPVAAWFYESQELKTMLQALAVVFLIGGFENINTIARQKELEFRRLTYISQSSALIGSLVTVALAFWWRNVWALVLGQIATTIVSAACSYFFVPGRPRIAINWTIARELLSYGKFITGSSIVLFLATTMDTAVIGKLIGTQELGYYVLAFTIANLVTASLSKLASGVMMPAYSKLQNDPPALRRAYLRTMQFITFITLPATVGVLVTAEFLIHVIYGAKWSGSVVPLQILVCFGLLRALASINGYLFEGVGKPHVSFYVGLLRLALLACVIVPLTVRFGLPGAAASVTFAMAVQWVSMLLLANRMLSLSLGQNVVALWGPFWKSALMGAGVLAVDTFVDGMTKTGLAVMVAAGVGLYVLLNARLLMQVSKTGLKGL